MEENTAINSATPQTATPVAPQTPANTNDTVSSPLLKRPLLWLGVGAVLIVLLATMYVKTGTNDATTQEKETTESVQIEPTGTIEIHEQTEADAIDVGNIDDDFTDIEKDVKQL